MKDSNKLFELIKAMSASEKGYFKKYTLTHAKNHDQVYIRLFNILSSQKEYDEKKLVNALKKNSVSKKFGSYQNYLYKLILRSQRAYHSDVSFSTKTMELLLDAILLKNKGLIDHSNKLLEQAKRSAIDEDDLILLMKIQQQQRENNIKTADHNLIELNCNELSSEMFDLSNQIKEDIEINRLRNETHLLNLKYGDDAKDAFVRNRVKRILIDPLLDPKKKFATLEMFFWSLYIKHVCYAMLGDLVAVVKTIKMQIAVLEKHPLFHTDHLKRRYGLVLCDILREFLVLEIEEAEEIFKKIQSIKMDSIQLEIQLFYFSYSNIMGAYIHYQIPEKGIALIPELTINLKKHSDKLSETHLLIIQGNISILYFMKNDFSNALKWMNKTLKYSKNELRLDTYSEVRILNILIHYELKNFMLVDSLLIALERALTKSEIMDPFSKIMIYHLKKIIFLNDKKERNEQLLLLKGKLNILLKDERDKKTYLLSWIDKKLEEPTKK